MAAISVPQDEDIFEELADGLEILIILYLLSEHYPRVYQALQWTAHSIEYAEKGGRWFVRLLRDAVFLELTGISDVLEALF